MDQKLTSHFPNEKISMTGAFRRQLETIDVLEWCTTATAGELKQFFVENKFDAIEEDAVAITFRGPENVALKFYLAEASSFHKILFQTSCSEDFLVGWAKQCSIPANAASEDHIFQSAGLPYTPA